VQNLLWVVGAVVFSTLVICLIWLRNRKPTSMEAGIKEFSRELRALAPEDNPATGRHGRVDRAG
jgi:hypothetical protein